MVALVSCNEASITVKIATKTSNKILTSNEIENILMIQTRVGGGNLDWCLNHRLLDGIISGFGVNQWFDGGGTHCSFICEVK